MRKHAAKYYRRITERLPQNILDLRVVDAIRLLKSPKIRAHVQNYSLLFLMLSFFILAVYGALSYLNYENVKREWVATGDNLAYWEDVAIKQGNSPDAYYRAGVYAANLRDNKKAVEYLNRAVELDPGFVRARALVQQLTN